MTQFPEESLNLSSTEGFGYFPGYPGQKLNKGQYEITWKVGFGSRSSTWLVLDSQIGEYFSVKIFTVHETLKKPSIELEAIETATRQAYTNLYQVFTETSHHGNHLCLVLDVAGSSLEDLRLSSPTKSLSRHIVQRTVACVVLELEKLHKFGFIHGAVTARNIVFEIDASRDELDAEFAKLPPCKIESNISIDGVEYPIVRSHPAPCYVEWHDSWDHINRQLMTLINLGHAQMEKRKKSPPTWEKSRMGKSLRPPEVILGLPYTSKADIWVLGCTTYHLLTGKPLVPEEKGEDDGTMLGWLISMSGKIIPPDLALKSKLNAQYFDANGIFKLETPSETLESQISSSGTIPADDVPGVVKFIQACLTLNPSDRPTTDDLFRHEWVQPGFQCCAGH